MTLDEALKKYPDNKTMLRRSNGIPYSVKFLRDIKTACENKTISIPHSFEHLLNDKTWELDNGPS